jgi:hypothetical protein
MATFIQHARRSPVPRAPAVLVTPGTALHRRLPRHEAVQHSQGLAFPPQWRIRVRSNSTCGSAPHAPGVARHSYAPHRPRPDRAGRVSWGRGLSSWSSQSGIIGVRASHIRGLPRRHASRRRHAPRLTSPRRRCVPSSAERTADFRTSGAPRTRLYEWAAGTCHRSRQHVRSAGSPSMPGQAPPPTTS